MPESLAEPFSGLWNRRGDPILDGRIRLTDLLGPIGLARPCREKVGNLDPHPDDLIYVLPPGARPPPLSDEMRGRMVATLGRGGAVLLWATSPAAVAAVRRQLPKVEGGMREAQPPGRVGTSGMNGTPTSLQPGILVALSSGARRRLNR